MRELLRDPRDGADRPRRFATQAEARRALALRTRPGRQLTYPTLPLLPQLPNPAGRPRYAYPQPRSARCRTGGHRRRSPHQPHPRRRLPPPRYPPATRTSNIRSQIKPISQPYRQLPNPEWPTYYLAIAYLPPVSRISDPGLTGPGREQRS